MAHRDNLTIESIGDLFPGGMTLYMGICRSIDSDGTVYGEPQFGSESNYHRIPVTRADFQKCKDTLYNTRTLAFNRARTDWGSVSMFFMSETVTGKARFWGHLHDGIPCNKKTLDINADDEPAFGYASMDINVEIKRRGLFGL
jgi:hypothetical protein